MAVVAIIMSLNFAACSDDDEDIDVSQLEGTWGLVRSAGWELCSEETEKDEWGSSPVASRLLLVATHHVHLDASRLQLRHRLLSVTCLANS